MLDKLSDIDFAKGNRSIIKGCYFVRNGDRLQNYFALAPSDDIALEIAHHCFGSESSIDYVYDDMESIAIYLLSMFHSEKIYQGYFFRNEVVVEYRSRKDIIDEVLSEL